MYQKLEALTGPLREMFKRQHEAGILGLRVNGHVVQTSSFYTHDCDCQVCTLIGLMVGEREEETREHTRLIAHGCLSVIVAAGVKEDVRDLALAAMTSMLSELGFTPGDFQGELTGHNAEHVEVVQAQSEDDTNMGNETQANVEKKKFDPTTVAVVRDGTKIVLPSPDVMPLKDAKAVIEMMIKEEDREIAVDEKIFAFPTEGAHALNQTLKELYGWVDLARTPSFFGSDPPVMIGVEIGLDDTGTPVTEQVPWGRIKIPGIDGYIETGFALQDSRFIFTVTGAIRQRHKAQITRIADMTRRYVREHSIYRGKAVSLQFPDPRDRANFGPHNCPKFIDVSKIDPSQLIFSDTIAAQVNMALFTPVQRTAIFRQIGERLKRGVLLAGPYGVGKTLAAMVLANECVKNGWTFFYVKNLKDLPVAHRLAAQYPPAVVFAEDVDLYVTGERTDEVQNILNTVDGVDTKNAEVISVYTTNDHGAIHDAFKRDGRIDVKIFVTPPDSRACERLVRQYTGKILEPNADLRLTGELLAGLIPATIKVVAVNAKSFAIGHLEPGDQLQIRAEDLEHAARLKLAEIEEFKAKNTREPSNRERAAEILGLSMEKGVDKLLAQLNPHSADNGKAHGRALGEAGTSAKALPPPA